METSQVKAAAADLERLNQSSSSATSGIESLEKHSQKANQDLSNLADATKQATQTQKEMEQSSSSLGGAVSSLSGLWIKAASAVGAYFAIDAIKDHIIEVTRLAGRYEELGIVMETAGRNAGYSAQEMNSMEQALRKQGIGAMEARDALTNLATANIDLSKASEMARAAQDLAVVGHTNSSEAFQRMIYGIKSGQTEILRTMGLNVSFEEGYKALAAQLGKTTESLDQNEKTQARVNIVLQEASKYTGIYEASMSSAEKQMGSLKRYIDDYKIAFGEAFQPAYLEIVKTLTSFFKDLRDTVSDPGFQEMAKQMGLAFSNMFTIALEMAKNMATTLPTIISLVNEFVTAIAGYMGVGVSDTQMSIDRLTEQREEIGKTIEEFKRLIELEGGRGTELSIMMAGGGDVNAAKEQLAGLERQYELLSKSIATATNEMNKSNTEMGSTAANAKGLGDAWDQVGQAWAKGGLLVKEAADVQKNKLKEVIEEYDKKIAVVNMTKEQQEAYNAVVKAAVAVDSEAADKIRAKVSAYQALVQAQDIANTVKHYEDMTKALDSNVRAQEVYNELAKKRVDIESEAGQAIANSMAKLYEKKDYLSAEAKLLEALVQAEDKLAEAQGRGLTGNEKLIQSFEKMAAGMPELRVQVEALKSIYGEIAQAQNDAWVEDKIKSYSDAVVQSTRSQEELITWRYEREREELQKTMVARGVAAEDQERILVALNEKYATELSKMVKDTTFDKDLERLWDQALRNIQDATADVFKSIFDGNLEGWEDLGDSIINVMKNTMSQILAMWTQQELIMPIANALGLNPGGTGTTVGTGTATGTNLIGTIGSTFSSGLQGIIDTISDVFKPVTDSLSNATMNLSSSSNDLGDFADSIGLQSSYQGAGKAGATTNWGSLFGSAALGAGLGYSSSGGSILGTLAGGAMSVLGSMIPGIGTAIGALASTLVGALFGSTKTQIQKEVTDAGLFIGYGGGDIYGSQYTGYKTTTTKTKSGLFGSKTSTGVNYNQEFQQLTSEQRKLLSEYTENFKSYIGEVAHALNTTGDLLSGLKLSQRYVRLAGAGGQALSEEQVKAAIGDFYADLTMETVKGLIGRYQEIQTVYAHYVNSHGQELAISEYENEIRKIMDSAWIAEAAPEGAEVKYHQATRAEAERMFNEAWTKINDAFETQYQVFLWDYELFLNFANENNIGIEKVTEEQKAYLLKIREAYLSGGLTEANFDEMKNSINFIMNFSKSLAAYRSGIAEQQLGIEASAAKEASDLLKNLDEFIQTTITLMPSQLGVAQEAIKVYVQQLITGRESMTETQKAYAELEARANAYIDVLVKIGIPMEEATAIVQSELSKQKQLLAAQRAWADDSFEMWQKSFRGVEEYTIVMEEFGKILGWNADELETKTKELIENAKVWDEATFVENAEKLGLSVENLQSYLEQLKGSLYDTADAAEAFADITSQERRTFEIWQLGLKGLSDFEIALEQFGLTTAAAGNLVNQVTSSGFGVEQFRALAAQMALTDEELTSLINTLYNGLSESSSSADNFTTSLSNANEEISNWILGLSGFSDYEIAFDKFNLDLESAKSLIGEIKLVDTAEGFLSIAERFGMGQEEFMNFIGVITTGISELQSVSDSFINTMTPWEQVISDTAANFKTMERALMYVGYTAEEAAEMAGDAFHEFILNFERDFKEWQMSMSGMTEFEIILDRYNWTVDEAAALLRWATDAQETSTEEFSALAKALMNIDPTMTEDKLKQVFQTIARGLNDIDYSLDSIVGTANDVAQAAINAAYAASQALRGTEATGEAPGFQLGGYHEGGVRIVGEGGPELEFTGPATIYGSSKSMNMLTLAMEKGVAAYFESATFAIKLPKSPGGNADRSGLMAETRKLVDSLADLTISTEDVQSAFDKLKNSFDKIKGAFDTVGDMIDELTVGKFAPVQSYEKTQYKYESLIEAIKNAKTEDEAAKYVQELQSFLPDYLEFMNSFGVNYQVLTNSVLDDLTGIQFSFKSQLDYLAGILENTQKLVDAAEAAKNTGAATYSTTPSTPYAAGEPISIWDVNQDLDFMSSCMAKAWGTLSDMLDDGTSSARQINGVINSYTSVTPLTPSTKVRYFQGGGHFGGGVRVVGERGPELEFTGPSRIYNSDQSALMISNAVKEALGSYGTPNNQMTIIVKVGERELKDIVVETMPRAIRTDANIQHEVRRIVQ